ncbi:MAG TPA: bifunctional phosphopantothenoylcysteine decarboxylase/phosphopantothenate--cysteine ligase CoaBC [Aggregatilineales bacterium]|nr:bifunctional phosphopantothenoylcysteine decarboxylase/phosphopantothenate--cysteine ligase CoaBC [Aggregatilineales bacterium]
MTTITVLEEKRIILGVTGSIAAYKAADLASKLTQAGAMVDVIMTDAAKHFVAPLTFQALTGRPVYESLWGESETASALPAHIAHVGLAESADLILIAPATASTIARLAHGFADDLLSVTVLAARCPVVLAPAMDGGMYENPVTQANLEKLRNFGMQIIEPEHGRFASGLEGRGRLPETSTLMGYIRHIMGSGLEGRHIVVTAGGTREALDPVRYISNHSSGKQGYAIAQAALDFGAEVTLISTVPHLQTPAGAKLVSINSAAEMRDAVLAHADCDALVMAAAVADLRPAQITEHKIKKQNAPDTLLLERTDDILAIIGQNRRETGRPSVVVGFAAETQDLIDNARAKLEKKNLDLIVANDLTVPGAGFATETNIVTFIRRSGELEIHPITTKTRVAEKIMQFIVQNVTGNAKEE